MAVGESLAEEQWTAITCGQCRVTWVEGWCPECDHRNRPSAAPGDPPSVCPVCSYLDSPLRGADGIDPLSVVCPSCSRHFYWPAEDQRQYLETQQRRWVPRLCPGCAKQRTASRREDLRGLAQAAERLAEAHRVLRVTLRDPEKIAWRYQRVQQQAQWVVTTYGRHLPQDFVYRFHGNVGAAFPSSPFDDTVPPHRAIQRLRRLTRELLGLLDEVLQGADFGEADW